MTAEQTVPDGVPVLGTESGTEPGTGTRRHVRDKVFHVIVTLTWTDMDGNTCVNTTAFTFSVPATRMVSRHEMWPEILKRAARNLGAPNSAPVLFYSMERDLA